MSKLKFSAQEGRALPLTLIALAFGCLLLPPFLNYINTNLLACQTTEEGMKEQYSADAGVEYAVWKLTNDRGFLELVIGSPIGYPVPVYDIPTSVNAIEPIVSITNLDIPNSWPGRWGGQGTGGDGWCGKNYRSVYFMSNEVGWVVGDCGRIMKTLDGGYGWFKLRGQSGYPDLYSVSRPRTGAGEVWTVGDKQESVGTIWYVDDEEETVHEISDVPNVDLKSIFFVDGDNGWAVGDHTSRSTVLKTTDGGNTWTKVNVSNDPNKHLRSVFFIDAFNGWAVGEDGTILHYNCIYWAPQQSGINKDLNDVIFVDVDHGWVVGKDGTILKTKDGGLAWVRQTNIAPPDDIDFHGISLVYNAVDRLVTGAVVGEHGHIRTMIRHSLDATDKWDFSESATGSRLNSVHFTNEEHGWAVGDGWTLLIYSCHEGLCAWSPPNNLTRHDKHLRAVWFAEDGLHGWAVGDKADIDDEHSGDEWIIGETEDGIIWANQTSSASPVEDLQGVSFAGVYTYTGWAVGDHGTILKSSNGGETWMKQVSPVTKHLEAIYTISSTLAYAVGEETDGRYLVLKTTDGNQWSRCDVVGLPYHENLNDIDFFCDTDGVCTGWAVGKEGTVVKITNPEGTPSFTDQTYAARQANGSKNELYGVCAVDSDTVWAVGRNETIIYTTDGGNSWAARDTVLPGDAELTAVQFSSSVPHVGCIVGRKHQTAEEKNKVTILKSDDGGENWTLIEAGAGKDLYDVFVMDACNGWAAGQDGVILHFFCPDLDYTSGCAFFDIESVATDLTTLSRVHLCSDGMHIDSWQIE